MKNAHLTDDFSDIELDFFKRGDDLAPPADDHSPAAEPAPESDTRSGN